MFSENRFSKYSNPLYGNNNQEENIHMCRHKSLDRRDLNPRTSPLLSGQLLYGGNKPKGLQNIGATCYMNATLQCFFHCKKLTKYLSSENYLNDNITIPRYSITSEYIKLVKELLYKNGQADYAPYDFKEILGQKNTLFKGIAANDSKDLILFLEEEMAKELIVRKKKNNIYRSNTYSGSKIVDQTDEIATFKEALNEFSKETSIIKDLFYFMIKTETICQNCKAKMYNFQVMNFLIFPLQKTYNDSQNMNNNLMLNNIIKTMNVNNMNMMNNMYNMFGMSNNNQNMYNRSRSMSYNNNRPLLNNMNMNNMMNQNMNYNMNSNSAPNFNNMNNINNMVNPNMNINMNSNSVPNFNNMNNMRMNNNKMNNFHNYQNANNIINMNNFNNDFNYISRTEPRTNRNNFDNIVFQKNKNKKNEQGNVFRKKGNIPKNQNYNNIGSTVQNLFLNNNNYNNNFHFSNNQNNNFNNYDRNAPVRLLLGKGGTGPYDGKNINKGPKLTLDQCFESYLKPDYLTGDNKQYCNKCGVLSNSIYSTFIYSSPNILILILNYGKGILFQCDIQFDEYINISKYIDAKNKGVPTRYRLLGAIVHIGPSSMGGHFIAFCRGLENQEKWYKLNDSIVSESTFSEIKSVGIPYVLFYENANNY